MKIVQLHEWTSKQFLNPTFNPKKKPIRDQKESKNYPKIKSNQKSELMETKKLKVVELYE